MDGWIISYCVIVTYMTYDSIVAVSKALVTVHFCHLHFTPATATVETYWPSILLLFSSSMTSFCSFEI